MNYFIDSVYFVTLSSRNSIFKNRLNLIILYDKYLSRNRVIIQNITVNPHALCMVLTHTVDIYMKNFTNIPPVAKPMPLPQNLPHGISYKKTTKEGAHLAWPSPLAGSMYTIRRWTWHEASPRLCPLAVVY